MAQITIYLDAELDAKLRTAAKQAQLSTSRWIAKLVEEKLANEWPISVREMAGSWEDFPESDQLRVGLEFEQREPF